MSLYIGTNSTKVADLIANKDNETIIKQLLKAHYLPPIGSIKFVARTSMPSIPGIYVSNEIYHRNESFFAGWVVGDGSRYAKADFPEAFEVFGTRYGADSSTFRIPNLLNFYRLDNSDIVKATPEKPCKAMMLDHQHEIHTDVSFTTSGIIKNSISCVTTDGFGATGAICKRDSTKTINGQISYDIDLSTVVEAKDDDDYGQCIPAFHNGSGDWTLFTSPLTINAGADFSLVNTNYTGEDVPDCYPAYTTLIPLIYIGADI